MLPPYILLLKSVSSPDWQRLAAERRRYMRSHYADSTHKTRSVQVKAYIGFCETFEDRLDPYPCGSDQVCLYMSFLARRLCYSSIRNYLSALNNHLKDLGCEPIDYKDHMVRKCMAGIRRVKGDVVKQAFPLLPTNLVLMFSFLSPTMGHTSVRAAMLLSFRALLRKAHVTVSNASLQRQDFTFHPWGMMVRVSKSKTIQYKERVHLIPVTKVRNRRLCAVYWVTRHFLDCPAHPGAAAFRIPRGGNSIPLQYSYYTAVIKFLCSRAGLDQSDYSSHSLRRGGATFLRLCGATLDQIKERGDWKSDAVYAYLKASVIERMTLDMRVALILEEL